MQTVVTGMVLFAAPNGEFDKRVVILTKERGKITAFARGARRQNSSLLAATNPFAFGTFSVYEGKTAYTLVQAQITNYFRELASSLEEAYYGFYFLELAGYYAQENEDETELLKLLYQSMRALMNPHLDNRLVRAVFELKAMVIQGEYPEVFACVCCKRTENLKRFVFEKNGVLCEECCKESQEGIYLKDSVRYTLQYVIAAPIEKLYTFTLTQETLGDFQKIMKRLCRQYQDRNFKSLEILEEMSSLQGKDLNV
ncbi:MAG: DNA repair protein RecO [Lachnospiraceae bacterium]|nr:DNA repair protein RecO [Robinsoniella sp.]MDY3767743.1 DNA repair protein RecO [Lachnospiraceae bacterium]